MPGLSEEEKNRISEALNATQYQQRGFALNYDDDKNPVAVITFSSRPEYRFVIDPIDSSAFATSESPGVRSDAAETIRRSDFNLCLDALKKWVERIVDRERDWMLDEFGGAADRLPSY